MIEGLGRRGGAEEVSPPTYDALVRKWTSAATFTDLPNLSTFYLCLLLPCMPLIAVYVRTVPTLATFLLYNKCSFIQMFFLTYPFTRIRRLFVSIKVSNVLFGFDFVIVLAGLS